MNGIISTTLCSCQVLNFKCSPFSKLRNDSPSAHMGNRSTLKVYASSSNELDTQTAQGGEEETPEPSGVAKVSTSTASSARPAIEKDLKKAVQKTAATFAPRASTASKNPAVPGSTLYTVFEVQAYASMLLGGALSFNLIFPSNEPDIWRLMGMWSIWMFTIPSLRARDCLKNEKEALNYLFLLVPLLNVTIPFFWKSFAVVWSADTVAFLGMYAWKMGWLQKTE
ncbi:hypothetical protein RJ639_021837 [Escallonia herrerae]|uniref:Uncharacterized protein n=1 Tax=Escallonia herrerae TaxID=1293975 RepID=A0AA88V512_9ASTE|nr:hypothetical protein RJ639_021837 [Escallonia herrerae]